MTSLHDDLHLSSRAAAGSPPSAAPSTTNPSPRLGEPRTSAAPGASTTLGETTVRRRPLEPAASGRPVAWLYCAWSPDRAVVGLRIPLDGRAIELGRGAGLAHRVEDPQMSRHHVRLAARPDGTYEICDLGTPNGTFVDGVRLAGVAPFTGRVIAAGSSLFVVDTQPDADAMPAASRVAEASVRGLVGVSPAMSRLRQAVATTARTDGAVLLLGSTGVGKEVTAQAIHEASGRSGAFVPVNCAAIPAELAEAEFFGTVRGAYTGADADRAGLFEQASGGTLFLDEVGDLPLHLQAKLLRVLEDGVVRRIGSTSGKQVDVRIVAATHVDLDASGFRLDLLARLSDWVIRIPRLADRRSDIMALWDHFCGLPAPELAPEFREALLLYDWPMNVRELRKLARRSRELAQPGEPLPVACLPRAIQAPVLARLGRLVVDAADPARAEEADELPTDANTPGRQVVVDALIASGGNVKKAALDNGWHRTQLYRWLRRLRIDPNQFRRG